MMTLLVVSVAVAVGNNMGVIAGPSAGSRVLKGSVLTVLAATGLLAGYFLEGWKLGVSAEMSYWETITSLALAIVILAALTAGGFVTSITQVFVGIYIGHLIYLGDPGSLTIITKILVFWAITFASSVIVSYTLIKVASRRGRNTLVNNLITLKLLSIVMVFFTAYTLGANTIGFVAGFAHESLTETVLDVSVAAGVIAGILVVKGSKGVHKLGSGFFGLKYTSTIAPYFSTLILTEVGTQFSIPLPMSISIFSGILGTAAGMKLRLISARKVGLYILVSWVLPLFTAILLSYLVFTFHFGTR